MTPDHAIEIEDAAQHDEGQRLLRRIGGDTLGHEGEEVKPGTPTFLLRRGRPPWRRLLGWQAEVAQGFPELFTDDFFVSCLLDGN